MAYIKQITVGGTAYDIKAAADVSGNILMNNQIKRNATNCSWYNGRDNALIRIATYSGYSPILSCKTTNGSGEIGPHSNNYLYVTYQTDTVYNSGANGDKVQVRFHPSGGTEASIRNIIAGTSAPSSSTGVNGEVYLLYV